MLKIEGSGSRAFLVDTSGERVRVEAIDAWRHNGASVVVSRPGALHYFDCTEEEFAAAMVGDQQAPPPDESSDSDSDGAGNSSGGGAEPRSIGRVFFDEGIPTFEWDVSPHNPHDALYDMDEQKVCTLADALEYADHEYQRGRKDADAAVRRACGVGEGE